MKKGKREENQKEDNKQRLTYLKTKPHTFFQFAILNNWKDFVNVSISFEKKRRKKANTITHLICNYSKTHTILMYCIYPFSL
mmetsp:Transcript_23209/g.28497  ORF Transcript_23209/g.28497 Transcript_23209/m.28497 type:complete len:82 (-) Transcript_23209:146-391(-)